MANDLGPARVIQANQVANGAGVIVLQPGEVGAMAIECENPACPTQCPRVALFCQLADGFVSFHFTPEAAREIAFDILAVADRQDPDKATERRKG